MARYLTVKEVSSLTRWAEQTIRNKRSEGTLPFPAIKLGRKVLFRKDDIEKWLNSVDPRQENE